MKLQFHGMIRKVTPTVNKKGEDIQYITILSTTGDELNVSSKVVDFTKVPLLVPVDLTLDVTIYPSRAGGMYASVTGASIQGQQSAKS
jgi:hypothetical protein